MAAEQGAYPGQKQTEEADREELLKRIARLSESYTPEWHFDREHPDAGTALALLFAELFGGTMQRFAQISDKHRSAFFEQIGLEQKEAQAARGYVTFGLSSDEHGGTFLAKGTTVSGRAGRKAPQAEAGTSADIQSSVEEITYRTTEALYVTPAALTSVLFVDGARDYIALKDPNGCFAPFAAEEKNLQEHVFYLCHSEVLSVSGSAEVSLLLERDGSCADERCSVEHNSIGSAEKERSGVPAWMLDREACSFLYASEDGFEAFGERRAEEDRLILHMEEGAERAACRTLFGKEGYWICCKFHQPWKEESFLVKGIRVASRRENIQPDFIWNEQGEQENGRFLPFGESPLPFAECYMTSGEALGKPGARVTVSFQVDYEKIPFDNSYRPDRRWKMLIRRADFAPDPEYDITVEQVIWEYYNGAGWSRLAVDRKWERLFDGTGARAGQQVRITFVCPPDAALLSWQAQPTRYLRVRVLKMKNLYRPKGAYIVPVIGGVRLSFTYENGGREPELAAAVNNREINIYETSKKSGEPACLELFCGRKEHCPTLYLGFQKPLTGGPLRMLITVQEERSGILPCLKFSYSCAHGFAPLSVVDGTDNFKKSGTFAFHGKDDHVQTNICHEAAYWMCVQEAEGMRQRREKQSRIPRITGIFLNAAAVEALPGQTRESGGAAGCQPPGGVDRLSGSYGYVNRVINPLPLCGGCDRESGESALRRGSAALRHAGRAMTASDFEALAREACESVKKVRCFAKCGADGAYEPGAVTIVLLLKEFRDGHMYFDAVRTQLLQCLSERTCSGLLSAGRLSVTEPLFLELDCCVDAIISDQSNPFEVQEEIEKRVERFLHPLTGNYDGCGWDIGTVPNEAQMTNALKGIPGLLYIQNLRLTAYRNTGHERERVGLDAAAKEGRGVRHETYPARFMAPLPGTCKVVIRTEQA